MIDRCRCKQFQIIPFWAKIWVEGRQIYKIFVEERVVDAKNSLKRSTILGGNLKIKMYMGHSRKGTRRSIANSMK